MCDRSHVSEQTIDSRARRAARSADLVARKSRWRVGTIDNYGEFMLVDPFTNIPAAGFRYDLSAEEVIEFCMGGRVMSDTDFYVPDQVSLKLVPADAALTHESAKTEGCLKGWIPESWCCIDCGFNTAPCLSTRAETEAAFAAGAKDVEQTYNYQTEVYVVRKRVWAKAGMEEHGGCLCVGCLEKRIHRRLKPKDFPRNAVLNSPMLPATLRLQKRCFGKHLKVLP